MRRRASFFNSMRADADETAGAMRWAYEECAQVIDPHTAVALHAARASEFAADIPVVTLATAHPSKFRDAVEQATGARPSLPGRIGNLFEREERYEVLAADYRVVRDYILSKAVRPELL